MANYNRRTFVKFAGVSAAGVAFGSVLSACSSNNSTNTNNQTPARKNDEVIVVMTTSSEPSAGFDPFVSWGCGEHVHEPLIQSTLITTDINMEFVNDLATSHECSADGLKWTFGIRKDVKFTDGKPLTAADVAFTINGIINSDAAQADLSMVDEAVVIDNETVELNLNKPFNALLYTLAVVGIVPAHAHGADYGSNPIGSGRYMLEQWDKGQQIILEANPDYYGEAPKMKRVVVVFMEEAAALAAANAGQVDITYTSAVYSDQKVTGYDLYACKSVDSRGISLPSVPPSGTKNDGENEYALGNAVTSDLAIRQALNYAVDRDTMIKNVLNGYGTVAYSVSDNMPWASKDMQVKTDIAKAKDILTKGGWQAGSDGVFVKDGTRAAFDLWYSSSDSVRQALVMDFAKQMKEVGIEVTPKGGSWDDLYPQQFSSPVLWGWGSNSPTEIYYLNYSSGWGNFSTYENKKVDEYLDKALVQTEIEDSYQYWQKAQWDGEQGVAPQGAATWVWFANVDHLYFKRANLEVAKQKPHPHGHGWSLVNNVDQWSWAY